MAPRGSRGRGSTSRSAASSRRGRDQTQVHSEHTERSDSSTSESERSRSAGETTPIIVHGEKYYKAKDVAGKKRSKKKTSHIWDHGFEIVHAENGTRHYYCRICVDEKRDISYTPLVLNGTSSIHAHYRSKHDINSSGNLNSLERASSVTSAGATASPGPVEIIFQQTLERFKLLLIKWMVLCHIAFMQLENNYFRDLLNFLNPSMGNLVPSRTTFRHWIFEEFAIQKAKLRKELRRSKSNIHLSFDLWTSPNAYSIIAIISHFIDSNGYRRTKLLAIRQLKGDHSGENISKHVLKVIREYRIRKQIGFFILDNASTNDTAVDHILCSLYPEMSEKARKRRRLRCLAHVTNLVAKAFLLGQKAEEVVDELLIAEHHFDLEKISRVWKKNGVLGRLQNLIRYIRLSPQRRQKFKRCAVDKESWKNFNKLEV